MPDFVPDLPDLAVTEQNQIPCDAPDQEDVDALAALVRLRNGLNEWLPGAAVEAAPPVQWRDMLMILNAVANTVAAADTDPVAHYTPARIDLYPHPSVPLDGQCARCHRALDDQVHTT
jgi:hypothetical protein